MIAEYRSPRRGLIVIALIAVASGVLTYQCVTRWADPVIEGA